MVRRLLFIAAILLGYVHLAAQPVVELQSSRVSGIEYTITNDGRLGLPITGTKQTPGFIYPRGSGVQYLVGSGLWLAVKKRRFDSLARLVYIGYNPNSGATFGWPGEVAADGQTYLSPVLNALDVDHTTGRPMKAGLKVSWPLWQIGSTAPTMRSPGVFERDTSRRTAGTRYSAPAFVPGVDEQIVCRFTDTSVATYELGREKALAQGFPLGLQIQQVMYGWSSEALKNLLVVQYQVVNVGKDTLLDCYIGQAADLDIGKAPTNDNFAWLSADTTLQACAGWSAPEAPGLKTLVIAALETPIVDPATRLIDNARRGETEREIGLTGALRYTIQTDPKSLYAHYDSMAAAQRSTHATSGADIRALLSSGPFIFRPGDTAYFTLGYAIANVATPFEQGALEAIRGHVRTLRDLYNDRPVAAMPMFTDKPMADIAALPNPSGGITTVRGFLPGASHAELTVADALGRSVAAARSIDVTDGRFSTIVDLSGMPEGIYLARVRSGDRVTVAKIERMR